MHRALEEKFKQKPSTTHINTGCVIVNSLDMIISASSKNEDVSITGIERCLKNFSGYKLLNPNDLNNLVLYTTHFPTLEEANLISKEQSIKTVVCLLPYKNDLGIQLLEATGIKVILEPITVNDVLIGNSNVVLKRIDLDKITKSGIIIPDIVTQSRTRAVPCEVIACDIDCTRYEPGDTVIVDIISCQWLTFKNAQCIEDKFFTTLEKEILCKLEKEEN